MDRAPEHPTLTPSFCFNQTALRDFLRLSRSTIDDSISQNLNALLTPGAEQFDSSTLRQRQTTPAARRRQISSDACSGFKQRVLFPSWQMRSDVLNYCATVATSPDPQDPDQDLRDVESAKLREQIVDERLDPYSARAQLYQREPRTDSLASLIRNERAVEEIIRSRTWGLIAERCEDMSGTFQQGFDDWRRNNATTAPGAAGP